MVCFGMRDAMYLSDKHRVMIKGAFTFKKTILSFSVTSSIYVSFIVSWRSKKRYSLALFWLGLESYSIASLSSTFWYQRGRKSLSTPSIYLALARPTSRLPSRSFLSMITVFSKFGHNIIQDIPSERRYLHQKPFCTWKNPSGAICFYLLIQGHLF